MNKNKFKVNKERLKVSKSKPFNKICFNCSIKAIIDGLNEALQEGYTEFDYDIDSYYSGGSEVTFSVSGMFLETDEAYNKRIKLETDRYEKEKERIKREKEAHTQREIALYKELHKKYGSK